MWWISTGGHEDASGNLRCGADMSKRVFDLMLSVLGLVVLTPLLLGIFLWIKLTSPGPALYRARRVGCNGKLFSMYKFRSMVVNADRLGAGITAHDDLRVTPPGRVLRRTKLDELPQLFNVVKGDMSLVGPRPEDPRYVELYTPEQRQVLSIRPGITSWASIQFRNEEQLLSAGNVDELYRTQVMPQKLALELDYLARRSLGLDLIILFRTAGALFT
jgi:lipopolysaccharide/colanic/teichoic acid biosynthesis glycosyltransferase